MKRFLPISITLLLFTLSGVSYSWDYIFDEPRVKPICPLRISQPALIVWKGEQAGDSRYLWRPYEISGNRSIKPIRKLSNKENIPSANGAFQPACAEPGGSLSEKKDMPSPDGKWSVRIVSVRTQSHHRKSWPNGQHLRIGSPSHQTAGDKPAVHKIKGEGTFAEDLKNIRLVLHQVESGENRAITVPGHSMGEVCPLFWSQEPAYYFLNQTGAAGERSYRLIRFEPSSGSFEGVGITNGRAFLSPDGNWIVWETGRLIDSCIREGKPPCNSLIAYDVNKKNNYWLVKESSTVRFGRWK